MTRKRRHRRRIRAIPLAALAMVPMHPAPATGAETVPAFPGAEGFAASSTGGRGGDVFRVTNLNREGPGSFLEAIRTVPPEGRTIVFAVSGFIPIHKARLAASKVTIAGQTAPGGGVALTGSSFTISGTDVVIRHLRFRHGAAGNGGDCINPDGGADRLLIDHCDVLFSRDENLSSFRTAPPRFTFQWSINAWGLYNHSCGGLWLVDRATCHHSLWANNKTRNPKVIRAKVFDWYNNVTFGWDIGMNLAGADVPGIYQANIRGSSFIQGSRGRIPIFGGGRAPDGSIPWRVYIDDCALDGNGAEPPDVTAVNDELIDSPAWQKSDTPLGADPGTTLPKAEDRLTGTKKVISQAGPLRLDAASPLPLRDEVGTLLIEDLVQQRRRKIEHERDLGVPNNGFGTLAEAPAPPDTDADGMPDTWEHATGSDARRQDHNEPVPRGAFLPAAMGYTRLEEYLHFLAIPHLSAKPGETVEIDLNRYASGFRKPLVWSVTRPRVGTLALDPSGTARFRAPADARGRSGFNFTVTDADGSTWTQSFALLIAR